MSYAFVLQNGRGKAVIILLSVCMISFQKFLKLILIKFPTWGGGGLLQTGTTLHTRICIVEVKTFLP
jgi:hypothetical protein